LKKGTVLKLISWKHSFKRLNEESEIAKKKRQALDNLLENGRISQSTYELFNEEIDKAISEIERQQKALLEEMNSKMMEFEGQIRTLEILLANFEIQHVTGEVDEEIYQRQVGLLAAGLETAKHELDVVRDAVTQLSSGMEIPETSVAVQEEVEAQAPENVEVSEQAVEIAEEPASDVVEELPEPPAENVEGGEEGSFQDPGEEQQEGVQNTEEQQATETNAEGEEKQE
jgi:hypothetical protein